MIQLNNNVPYNDHSIQRAYVRLVFLFFTFSSTHFK